MDGHQPDAVDPQLAQIVKLGGHSFQIPDAVAVGIAEGVDENFVPDPVIVLGAFPQGPDLGQGLLGFQGFLRGGCFPRKFHSRPRGLGGGGWIFGWTRRSASGKQRSREQQAQKPSCP